MRGVPDHAPGGGEAGQAGDRGRGAVQLSSVLERLLGAPPIHRAEPGALDALGGPGSIPKPLYGQLEPGHGRNDRVHGPGDPALLLRATSLRGGDHADGGEGMKLAVIGAGATYKPDLSPRLARE